MKKRTTPKKKFHQSKASKNGTYVSTYVGANSALEKSTLAFIQKHRKVFESLAKR